MINFSSVSTASLALANEFHGPTADIGDVIGGVLGCPPTTPGTGGMVGNIGDVIGELLGCPGDVHI
jgi:hypothetical protein